MKKIIFAAFVAALAIVIVILSSMVSASAPTLTISSETSYQRPEAQLLVVDSESLCVEHRLIYDEKGELYELVFVPQRVIAEKRLIDRYTAEVVEKLINYRPRIKGDSLYIYTEIVNKIHHRTIDTKIDTEDDRSITISDRAFALADLLPANND